MNAFTSKDPVADVAAAMIVNEALRLDKDNTISFNKYQDKDGSVAKFAKEYKAAMQGDFRSGATSAQQKKDEKAANKFWAKYKDRQTRSGFAGSGEVEYTGGGKTFIVRRSPNGKSFYGSDHWIEVKEENELEEGFTFRYDQSKLKLKWEVNKNDQDLLEFIYDYDYVLWWETEGTEAEQEAYESERESFNMRWREGRGGHWHRKKGRSGYDHSWAASVTYMRNGKAKVVKKTI